MSTRHTILLGVTADVSLTLMRGFPEYLRDNGWAVHIVSAPGPALDALRQASSIHTHAVPMERSPSPLKDLVALFAWARLLLRVRPDVISVGTPKAGLLGGIAGFITRVPHRVYLLRGLRLETARGPTRRVLSFLEQVSIAVAHDVIAVSASLRDRAIDLALVRPQKIRVLGGGSSNGVDVDAYSSRHFSPADIALLKGQLGLVNDVPVIGFVGRLTPDKGLAVLAEARQILTRREVDHQLLIVGGIDKGEDGSLLTTITSAGREAAFTGHVADPRPYYRLMDVLCLPTFREGFPNVVLEAAASGIPTVTTDATGAIDSVVDGTTGIVVHVGSADCLASAFEVLLPQKPLRESMGAAALRHVTANFSRADVWERTQRYYRSLLSGSATRTS